MTRSDFEAAALRAAATLLAQAAGNAADGRRAFATNLARHALAMLEAAEASYLIPFAEDDDE